MCLSHLVHGNPHRHAVDAHAAILLSHKRLSGLLLLLKLDHALLLKLVSEGWVVHCTTGQKERVYVSMLVRQAYEMKGSVHNIRANCWPAAMAACCCWNICCAGFRCCKACALGPPGGIPAAISAAGLTWTPPGPDTAM